MKRPRVIVSFSGGKDSQAALLFAVEKYGKDNVEAVFCDTGWEHPDTYTHIQQVVDQLQIPLATLKSVRYRDFVDLAQKKHRFPATRTRFCTVELKIKPMIDWILEQDDNLIIIQGIRASESQARAAMLPECSYFREYFDNDAKGLYRKKDVIKWCKHHDASVLRPIFAWSAQQVIDYILAHGQQPNPLYKRGFSRVGCFPCIMARKQEIKLISKDEWARQRLIDAEQTVGHTFFTSGYIPERYCANGQYPTIQEVFNYVNRDDAQQELFENDESFSCMSLYHGLCE